MTAFPSAEVSTEPKVRAFYPALVGKTESFFLRLFLAAITVWSVWKPSKYDRMEMPAGISSWGLDFSWLGKEGAHPWFLGFTMLAGLAYTASVWLPTLATLVSVGLLSLCHLAYWTLANSQGNTFHGSNMTTAILLMQVAASVIWLVRERRKLPPNEAWPTLNSLLLYFSQCAIVSVYVTSAITKLGKSGGRWLLDSHYFAKSIQKVWRQHQYDDPTTGEFTGVSPSAAWLAEHPMTARLLFSPGLIFELFAFVLLWNRKWAFWFGAALIGMHVNIGFIMKLYFPEFEALLSVFCVNVPFLLAWVLHRRKAASGLA